MADHTSTAPEHEALESALEGLSLEEQQTASSPQAAMASQQTTLIDNSSSHSAPVDNVSSQSIGHTTAQNGPGAAIQTAVGPTWTFVMIAPAVYGLATVPTGQGNFIPNLSVIQHIPATFDWVQEVAPAQAVGDQNSSLVRANNHANQVANSARSVDTRHLLTLPLEIRHKIYECLMDTERTVCLSYHDLRHRRIGIMEPLLRTNRSLRREIALWTLGQPHLLDSRLWGLYNPRQTQVCVRYRDDHGQYVSILIGMPLTLEQFEGIALLWRAMGRADTDYYLFVNRVVSEIVTISAIVDAHDAGVQFDEQAALEKVARLRLPLEGDYNGILFPLPL